MSTFYRLKFLDVSITWWVILALYGLAAGCSGDGLTELPDASGDRIISPPMNLTNTPTVFDVDPRWLPVP